MTEDRLQRIVIAGGGTAGWMAAAAFARFFGATHKVVLVESEAIGTVGVGEATIPQIRRFNAMLGIDEAEFLRETQGSIKLGIEFVGWHRPDAAYMHAFGIVGRGLGLAPFRHVWRRGQALGTAADYGAYSFNEVAARAGRFAPPQGKEGAIPDLVHAFHFDAHLYAKYLRGFAEARGVERIEGKIETVETGKSGVHALQLESGQSVEGDLFIDCTGFRALLIGEALGVAFEDWSHWLPCDRAWAVPCARGEAFRPYTQSIAHEAGWQWRIPLQHRTGNGHVFSSSFMAEGRARDILLANLDGAVEGEPRLLHFTTGRRRPWAKNVVALGLAAGFMEPLESTSIHLVQSGLARLLDYLPRGVIDDASRDTFNRLSAFEWESIRDFLIAHYHLNERPGDFWQYCREMRIPDSLAEKIELFRSSGRIHREHEELFTEEGWSQLLIGQGVIPESWHPMVDQAGEADLKGYLGDMAQAYRAKAAQLPTHADFIARLSPQKEPA